MLILKGITVLFNTEKINHVQYSKIQPPLTVLLKTE